MNANELRVTTNENIDPTGIGTWAVIGTLFGETATVFTGSVFECTHYAAAAAR